MAACELQVPGLGLPYDHYAKQSSEQGASAIFPFAVDESWKASTITTRERAMLAFMNLITDKPDWTQKVHDDAIVAKWKSELEAYRRELGEIAKREREAAAAAEPTEPVPEPDAELAAEVSEDADSSDDGADSDSVGTDELDAIMNEIDPEDGFGGPEEDDQEEAEGESSSDDVAARRAAADAALANLSGGLKAYFTDLLGSGGDPEAEKEAEADASDAGADAAADSEAKDEDAASNAGSVNAVPGEEGVDWSGDGDSADTLDAPFPYNRGFTDKMFAFCIQELREKATIAESSGITSVLESAACVLKSDSVIPEVLRLSLLKLAHEELEDVPEKERDWHPGSDETVLDLVHPSLFPLVYGRTRALTDKTIGSPEEALELTGAGDVVVSKLPVTREEAEAWVAKHGRLFRVPEEERAARTEAEVLKLLSGEKEMKESYQETLSSRFQWLPAEVDITSSPKFTSYINNLHPLKHKALYGVLEEALGAMLPMLDAAVERCMTFDVNEDPRKRINAMRTVRKCTTPEVCKRYCDAYNRPRAEGADSDDEDEWEANEAWYAATHPIRQPNPGEYKYLGVPSYKSDGFFDGAGRIQVIVKLANIHLTPEKPAYAGGSWHLEGQLNERIAATALYYYDCDNISESRLAFRTPADAEEMSCEYGYEQSDFAGPEALFDINTDWNDGHTIMDHGSLLTRQGRTIVFPNVYQHHVEPFELLDKSKPGHRKILAFFLVDPKTRVISTQNVPPQQAAWGGLGQRVVEQRLPAELVQQVMQDVECPYDLETAKRIRLELMKERSALETAVEKELKQRTWNFCEH